VISFSFPHLFFFFLYLYSRPSFSTRFHPFCPPCILIHLCIHLYHPYDPLRKCAHLKLTIVIYLACLFYLLFLFSFFAIFIFTRFSNEKKVCACFFRGEPGPRLQWLARACQCSSPSRLRNKQAHKGSHETWELARGGKRQTSLSSAIRPPLP
jgi:hypothetical protein